MTDKIWKPTPRIRWHKRPVPETGTVEKVLQQEWETCTDMLLRHFDYEWRDVEEVG